MILESFLWFFFSFALPSISLSTTYTGRTRSPGQNTPRTRAPNTIPIPVPSVAPPTAPPPIPVTLAPAGGGVTTPGGPFIGTSTPGFVFNYTIYIDFEVNVNLNGTSWRIVVEGDVRGSLEVTGTNSFSGTKALDVGYNNGAVSPPTLMYLPMVGNEVLYMKEAIYSELGQPWVDNWFNRLEFFLFIPSSLGADQSHIDRNVVVKLVTRSPSASRLSVSDGGNIFLHRFRVQHTGGWHKVVVDPHPDVIQKTPLSPNIMDFGVVFNSLLDGSTDVSQYTYFDHVTQFSVGFERLPLPNSRNAEAQSEERDKWLFDGLKIYREEYLENEAQVYGMNGAFYKGPGYGVWLETTWSRNKDESSTPHEVRYAYHSLHKHGWDTGVLLETVLPVAVNYSMGVARNTEVSWPGVHTHIYVAVRPIGSTTFKELVLPVQLRLGEGDALREPSQVVVEEDDDGSGFPWYVLVIAGALCCCSCLFFVVAAVRRRDKKKEKEFELHDSMRRMRIENPLEDMAVDRSI